LQKPEKLGQDETYMHFF